MKIHHLLKSRTSASGCWRRVGILLLILCPGLFLQPAFAGCAPIVIPAFHLSSWNSQGAQNFIRRDETRYPSSLVGKGPGSNSGSIGLERSANVLAFQIPQLTGTVVAAQLQLRLEYLVSTRGAETYEWHTVQNPWVRVQLHRMLDPNVYESTSAATSYGLGIAAQSDSLFSISLNEAFIDTVQAAAGRKLIIEGSIVTLDNDPYNPQYLYLQRNLASMAKLVLVLAAEGAPEIIEPPASRMAHAGLEAEFHVLSCGAPLLSHQWQFNEADLPGATGASLMIPSVESSDAGAYRVVVSNSSGSITSAPALLQVMESPPLFATFPKADEVIAEQKNFFMRGIATGAPLPTYQWWFNDTLLLDATNNVLRFPEVTPALAGAYTLVASNESGTASSPPALLKVIPFSLSGPSDQTVLLSNVAQLSVWDYGYAPVTNYQWFHDGQEVVGANGSSLSFTATLADIGDYFVVAANAYGVLTSQVAVLTVETQEPKFSSSLRDKTWVAGARNQLTLIASAGPPAVYYWFYEGELIPGQHGSTLNFSNVTFAEAGQYSVMASNELGSDISEPAMITVIPGRISVNPSNLDAGAGSAAIFQAYYEGASPVQFQWRFNGMALPRETDSVLVLPSVTEAQAGLYTVSATNAYGDAISDPAELQVKRVSPGVQMIHSSLTARIGDFVWLTGNFSGYPSPACQWQFNGADLEGATNYILALSDLTFEAGGTYSIRVAETNGTVNSSLPHLQLNVIADESLDHWTSVNPHPQANPLTAVAWGNGRRIAVGQNGAVLISTDDQTWTARHLGPGIHLKAIAFGNGTFVAVGNADYAGSDVPALFSSPDGLEWTSHGLSVRGKLQGIAFGNGSFVVIGASDYISGASYYSYSSGARVILTSQNGMDWQKHVLPGHMSLASLTSVCFGNGLFVAVSDGGNYYTLVTAPTIFASADGIHWTSAPTSSRGEYNAVWASEGRFMAVGDNSVAASSSDGANWTIGSVAGASVKLQTVAYGNGAFVATSLGANAFQSSDGMSWNPISLPSNHDINGLTFAAGQFTAVADAGRILVSTDGIAWTDQCEGADTDLYGIDHGENAFVAVGEGAILSSEDGTNWIEFGASQKIHGVTHGNGLFVAVGKKGRVFTSEDGNDWITRATGTDEYLGRIVWGDNRFVVVGEKGTIVTSTDGTNWTVLPVMTAADLEGVAYGNGKFVAVGGYFQSFGAVGSILTSPDGLHWTDQPIAYYFGVRARGITFGDGKFVLVGNDGLVAVSTDGENWWDDFLDSENLRTVTYAADRFIAVGNEGLVISSVNGWDWTIHRCPASMNLRDIATTANAVLVVGSNGSVWQSAEFRPWLTAQMQTSGFQLKISGCLSRSYRVQASADLKRWTDLDIHPESFKGSYIDTEAERLPCRYYRMVPR